MAEIQRLAVGYANWQIERARAGTCPHCWGRMGVNEPTRYPAELVEARDGLDGEVEQTGAEFDCRDCGLRFMLPVALSTLDHPAVIAYYHNREVDPTETSYSGFPHVTGANGEVVAEDPVRIEVVVASSEAAAGLVLTLDATTEVVDVAHVDEPILPRPGVE